MHYFDCKGVSLLASFGYLPNDHKARRDGVMWLHGGFRPGARLFLLMIFIGQLARFCRLCIKAELASPVATIAVGDQSKIRRQSTIYLLQTLKISL